MRASSLLCTAVLAALLSVGVLRSSGPTRPLADPGPTALGAADSPVVVRVIGDFECPFSARAAPVVRQLAESWGRSVRVEWHDLPLSFHAHALEAAKAARAAARQGRFFAMHDALFRHQRDLGPVRIDALGASIGLDMDQFRRDLQDPAIAQAVERDRAAAMAVGAMGTPAYLVGGRLLEGLQTLSALERAVRGALGVADALRRSTGATGLELQEAVTVALDAERGPQVVDYFIRGLTPPPPTVEEPEAEPEMEPEMGPEP
jgi:2-hydroxychromene-2-carboxylate isomerase